MLEIAAFDFPLFLTGCDENCVVLAFGRPVHNFEFDLLPPIQCRSQRNNQNMLLRNKMKCICNGKNQSVALFQGDAPFA